MTYKSPLSKLAFAIFCLMLAIILREIVRAEAVDPVPIQYKVITYEEYLTRYEPSESPTIDSDVEVEEQVEMIPEVITISLQASETYTITAYCSCEICCGQWAKNRPNNIVIGAWGKELIAEYSVASPLPFGTKVSIDGKTYEVMDRTATWIADKYNGKVIDIYFGSDEEAHERALKFGRQQLEVEIIGKDYD